MHTPKPDIVALIEWSHLVEDFLDNIGLTLESFSNDMTGGWLFGYVEALQQNNVQTVIFCFSATVKKTTRITHQPTGATISILPSPRLYRYIRKRILNPYTSTVSAAAGNVSGLKYIWYSMLLKVAAYTSTPLLRLRTEIKKQHCSLILCQDYEHARFDLCVLLGKLMRLPVFASFQGGNWQISSVERFIRPFTLKRCHGLIVAPEIEIDRLGKKYKYPANKISKIFNPLDLLMWAGANQANARAAVGMDAEARIIVWHGRVDYYRKGLDILLDAWELISKANACGNYRLLLIGTGNDAALLKQELSNRNLKGIEWINQYINDRKQIYLYLKSADIYVFPSRNEGFAVAPLEAMACALPLVAFNAPGIADVLKNGEQSGGILLQESSSETLANTLLRLLEDKFLCEQLGHAAQVNMEENFSLGTIGKQLKKTLFK